MEQENRGENVLTQQPKTNKLDDERAATHIHFSKVGARLSFLF
jgi:hypothetical protein